VVFVLFRFPLHPEHGDMALASGSCAGSHLGSSDDSHYLEVRLANDRYMLSYLVHSLAVDIVSPSVYVHNEMLLSLYQVVQRLEQILEK